MLTEMIISKKTRTERKKTLFTEFFDILMSIAQTSLCWTSRFGNYQPDVRRLKKNLRQ
ncbi:MAG: hypothetical protein IJH65_11170 [Methanobrevibacter sp.]|nr:hypothetical protein [Methanobrevibacter sp.]